MMFMSNRVSFWPVVRCESGKDVDVAEAVENGDLGIVGDDVQDYGDVSLSPAPGVETICVFPKNPGKGNIRF